MAAAPLEHPLGGGGDGGLGPGQAQGEAAQILEPAEPLQRAFGRIGRAVEVHREHGGLLPEAEEEQLLAAAGDLPGQGRGEVGELDAAVLTRLPPSASRSRGRRQGSAGRFSRAASQSTSLRVARWRGRGGCRQRCW